MKGKTGTKKGLSTIVKHLARAAEKASLLGNSDNDTRPFHMNSHPS